jgi:membrane protein YqaA with SNARE-associated domain
MNYLFGTFHRHRRRRRRRRHHHHHHQHNHHHQVHRPLPNLIFVLVKVLSFFSIRDCMPMTALIP